MSDSANTYLKQARGFLQMGDAPRAVELLEKARLLARDDRRTLAQVLSVLSEACQAAGMTEDALRYRQQADELAPAQPPPYRGAAAPDSAAGPMVTHLAAAPHTGGRRTVVLAAALAALVSILATGGLVYWLVVEPATPAPPPVAAANPTAGNSAQVDQAGSSTDAAADAPDAGDKPTGPTVVAAADPPVTANAAASPPPAPPPAPVVDRQQLLQDNVGLLIVMLRFEGRSKGKQIQIDVPLGTGTAFAIDRSGLMLTNKHVLETDTGKDVPLTLAKLGMPTVTRRGTSYKVCFGPDASDQYVAKTVFKSAHYDMGLVKIDRTFDHPLTFAPRRARQGDDVFVCGFPGIVMSALNEEASSSAKIAQLKRKWEQTGRVDPMDSFSRDSFASTLTKGIVSAPERNVKNVGYLQMDAAISPGSSGGPVLNTQNQVLGIATWGISQDGENLGNYNFALLIDQLRFELKSYLSPPPSPDSAAAASGAPTP